jgi:hypothetical protein
MTASGPFVHYLGRLDESTEIRHFVQRLAGIDLFVTLFLHTTIPATGT